MIHGSPFWEARESHDPADAEILDPAGIRLGRRGRARSPFRTAFTARPGMSAFSASAWVAWSEAARFVPFV